MSLADIFHEIEGPKQDTYLNLASGLRIFKIILEDSAAVSSLIEYIGNNPEQKHAVHQRVQELLDDDNDPTTVHYHDSAIASYLFALSKTDNILAYEIAKHLIRVGNLWWSNLLAADVVKSMKMNAISVNIEIRYDSSSTLQVAERRLPANSPYHRELILRVA